ncbi:unnamed protein product [Strongylus vulgaris]|uniref:Uncharacterized protein n=1 Tax=Strongylus vulgaris TaxID=40348 RepID=A0A3P7M393_STRVU|nr:unnamed protein product [Strongylus vulgaris]
MRAVIFFLVAGVVFADYQSQNSGYENAEIAQPTPEAPLSADGGDQQAYNSDTGSDAGMAYRNRRRFRVRHALRSRRL